MENCATHVTDRKLPQDAWQSILLEALHTVRSLLCTTTNATPYERFLGFERRSMLGKSLPAWLLHPGTVLLRRFIRSKDDPMVEEVKLLCANPSFAQVRFPSGRESFVSTNDLVPLPTDVLTSDTSTRLTKPPQLQSSSPKLPQLQSDSPELPQLQSDSPELPQLQSDSPELPQLQSDSPELPQLQSDSPELPQLQSDSPELPQLQSDSPELPQLQQTKEASELEYNESDVQTEDENLNIEENNNQPLRRSSRIRKPPERYGDVTTH